ncbi:zinc-ribbon domain-containing protein [Thermococcus barophilus]|uniref:zinc-ribbon domain-containing protein n=1 Tax=Thermococcus barophilus TaxID=55802 RepID=UPI0009E85DFB|nr:zinc-ribbon domain-containing protein [Thermococcus barophilus]
MFNYISRIFDKIKWVGSMYCPKCGTQLDEEFDFCPVCGYDLRKVKEKIYSKN